MTGPGRRIDIKTVRKDVSRNTGVRPGLGTHPHADQSVHRSGGSLSGQLNPRCRKCNTMCLITCRSVKRTLVFLLVFAGVLAACGGGGPSEAVRVACAPFKDLPVSSPPATGSSRSSAPSPVQITGSYGLPTKWVSHLLSSGDDRLVEYAKTFSSSDQADSRVVGKIKSRCRQLDA